MNIKNIRVQTKKEESSQHPIQKSKKKRRVLKFFLLFLLIVVILGALGYFGYSWWNLKKELQKIQTPEGTQELQKKQTEEIIEKLKAHTVLPEDEQPIIVTVIDATALKKQSNFYEMAKNGDLVIIYFKAKKAYLYDPIADRILNIGPVITEGESSQSQTQPSPTSQQGRVTVEVRNGTAILGLGAEMAKKIQKIDSSFDVLPATDADKKYTKTLLIVNNADKKLVAKIEKELGVTAQTEMPEGERGSSANILVIVGK